MNRSRRRWFHADWPVNCVPTVCAHRWALEPHWRRLRDEFGGALDCRYRMAGMIADWDRYNDPLNAVSGRYKWAGLAAGAAPFRGSHLDRRGTGDVDTLTVREYQSLPAWRRASIA